jgi:hypothetical protein
VGAAEYARGSSPWASESVTGSSSASATKRRAEALVNGMRFVTYRMRRKSTIRAKQKAECTEGAVSSNPSLTSRMRNSHGISHRTAAGTVDAPRHRSETSTERHVVFRASNPAVCLDRQLSVAQQLALPSGFRRRLGFEQKEQALLPAEPRRSARSVVQAPPGRRHAPFPKAQGQVSPRISVRFGLLTASVHVAERQRRAIVPVTRS